MRFSDLQWVKSPDAATKSFTKWPVNKKIFANDVGAGKVAPCPRIGAVGSVIAHDHVMFGTDMINRRRIRKQRRKVGIQTVLVRHILIQMT